MAWILNGKHFGGYTYEHWFDDDYAPGTGDGPDAKTPEEAEPSDALFSGREDSQINQAGNRTNKS
jgi:hypothetical protein